MKDRAGGDSSSDRAAGPRRPDDRRILRIALALSAVAHLIGIAVYPLLFDTLRPDNVSFPVPSSTSDENALEVIRLLTLNEPDEPEPAEDGPEEPEEEFEPAVPGGLIGLPPLGDPIEVDLGPPPLTAAERLRPNLRDAEIWAPLDRVLGVLTPAHREELLASGRLQEWYDSVRIAENAERALTDWTFTDDSGKRWGVADGRVYLGDFSLPLPFEFGVTPGNREEVNQRLYQWGEIERQSRRMELQDSWRERSEAIRARRDRERSSGDSARGPGGS